MLEGVQKRVAELLAHGDVTGILVNARIRFLDRFHAFHVDALTLGVVADGLQEGGHVCVENGLGVAVVESVLHVKVMHWQVALQSLKDRRDEGGVECLLHRSQERLSDRLHGVQRGRRLCRRRRARIGGLRNVDRPALSLLRSEGDVYGRVGPHLLPHLQQETSELGFRASVAVDGQRE